MSYDIPADTGVKTEVRPEGHDKDPNLIIGRNAFTRKTVPRSIIITVGLPKLLPDLKFTFKLRLALSKEIQDATQKLVGRPQAEIDAAQKTATLDEVCDLLQDVPTGFGDWPTDDNRAPGLVLHDYVTQTNDPDARFILDTLISGVNRAYWGTVAPREFPSEV